MNHYKSVITFIGQKRSTDPTKVRLELVIERNTRANPCVDKQIVAKPATITEVFKEGDVACRDGVLDELDGSLRRHRPDPDRIDTVALEALKATKLKPARHQFGFAVDNPQEDFLVIAEQEYRLDAQSPVIAQALDHLGRTWTSIDEIADEHE